MNSKEFMNLTDTTIKNPQKGEAMVGFKFFSLMMFLSLALVGCMPSNKQTECKSNEAFNPILRTCVPVLPSTSNFVTITDFAPSSNLSVFKNSTNFLSFSVAVNNPYNEAYTMLWTRNFNGIESTLADNDTNNFDRRFLPAEYAAQVGVHIIGVKVKNSTGQIVDSQSWNITLMDSPTPYFSNPVPSTPAISGVSPLTTSGSVSISYNNNNAILPNDTRIEWYINATPQPFCTTPACYNTTVQTSQAKTLNYNPSSLGIGNHIIKARLMTNSVVYAEYTWVLEVKHPDRQKITGSFLVDNDGNSNNYRALARATIPYSNPYDDGLTSAFRNFISTTDDGTTFYSPNDRADFCIRVANGSGTYAGDTNYVKVRFYLDSNTSPVYEGTTSDSVHKVCLSDASNVILQNLVFPTTGNHYIYARVIDEATNAEYTIGDLASGSGIGVYPVSWQVVVKELNDAPTVAFGTVNTLACSGGNGVTTRSQCAVTTDTNFTTSIRLIADDYFAPPVTASIDESKFTYRLELLRDTTVVAFCDDVNDNSGPNYECTFNIASYGASAPMGPGPYNVHQYSWSLRASISDTGTPYSGGIKTSQILTWALDITEKNTAPRISPAPTIPAAIAEKASLSIDLSIEDDERDNTIQTLYVCKDAACAVRKSLASTTTSRNSSTLVASPINSSYTLEEDFLHYLDGTPLCKNVTRTSVCNNVPFIIVVRDIPQSGAVALETSYSFTMNITNVNPSPVASLATNPVTTLSYNAFMGMPFYLLAPTFSDASLVASESQNRAQWFARIGGTTEAITGATTSFLRWVPGITAGSVYLKYCVEDQSTFVISTVTLASSTCSAEWQVNVKDNFSLLTDNDVPNNRRNSIAAFKGTELYNATSVNYATAAYTAYVKPNFDIVVAKRAFERSGVFNTTDFPDITLTLPGAINSVEDLSMTGTDTALFVSLRYSTTGAPGSYKLRVYRIDISGTKSEIFKHNRSFGYNENDVSMSVSSTGIAEIPHLDASGVTFKAAQFDYASSTSGDTITVEGVTATYGTSFCISACNSDTAMAASYADFFNQNTDPSLKGLYAEASGDTVVIKGYAAGQAIQAYSSVGGATVGKVGRIFIAGTHWHVPFVDPNLAGAHVNKISMFQGIAANYFGPANTGTVISGALDAALTTTQPSTHVSNSDSFLDGADRIILLGNIASSGSVSYARKLRVTNGSYAVVTTLNAGNPLFGSYATYNLKLSGHDNSAYYYILGHASVDGTTLKTYYLWKFDKSSGALVSGKHFSDPTFFDSSTAAQTALEPGSIADIDIQAYTQASSGISYLRIFAISNYSGAYHFTTTTTTSSFLISCNGSNCERATGRTPSFDQYSAVSVGTMSFSAACTTKNGSDAFCRVGDEGYDDTPGTPSDDTNLRDMIFVGFTTNGSSTSRAGLGVFNARSEPVSSTTNSSVLEGIFRPSFFAP